MNYLSIDIETRSGADIKEVGLFKYTSDKDFKILLIAYAFDDEEVKIVDLERGETLPLEFIKALNDKNIIKRAFNVFFEVTALNKAGLKTDISEWECTMIKSFYLGLNGSLERVGSALLLEEDKAKDRQGKALIKYFCTKNSKGVFNTYKVDEEKWELFKNYCKRDVVAEREIAKTLEGFKLPSFEKDLFVLDYEINKRGVHVDEELVENAVLLDEIEKNELLNRSKYLTGLSNVNSPLALCEWLSKRLNIKVDSVSKEAVKELLKNKLDEDIKEVLVNRQKTSKSSTAKYTAIKNALNEDKTVKGLLQFYGTKTGRWAGRLVQVQNLPRNYTKYLDENRRLLKAGNFYALKMIEGDIADTLSQLIRTAFIPKKGNILIVSDFSAIEARVLAYLARENWRNEFFKTDGDIYCQSASLMFSVPVEKNGVNKELRQKGKVAELACGYGGAVGALKAMGADKMGLDERELIDIVKKWRSSNKNIVNFWEKVENAVIDTVETGKVNVIDAGLNLITRIEQAKKNGEVIEGLNFLTISLPSSRKLYYFKPSTTVNRFGSKSLSYKMLAKTGLKLESVESYGGSLVENITQAVARDCLAVSLLRLKERGYSVVMHIHDEVVIEHNKDELEEVNKILSLSIPWAKGLNLKASGFTSNYYMKD